MIDIISISFLVVTVLMLGSWYAVRTYRLLKADQQPPLEKVDEALLERLRTKMAEAEDTNPLLKQFNMTVHIDTSAFTAALSKGAKAVTALGTAIGNSFELVMVSKKWYFVRPYLDWHDLWVGCYWKYEEGELSDTFDELNIYVCIIPTLVFRCYRQRKYQVVPKIDKRIDPVCIACGMPHSRHVAPFINYPLDTNTEIDSYCAGKFI